jgi:hypothetical protein
MRRREKKKKKKEDGPVPKSSGLSVPKLRSATTRKTKGLPRGGEEG